VDPRFRGDSLQANWILLSPPPRGERRKKVESKKPALGGAGFSVQTDGDSLRVFTGAAVAVFLNTGGAEPVDAVAVEQLGPRAELFFREVIAFTGLGKAQDAVADGGDDLGLTAHDPAAGLGGRQLVELTLPFGHANDFDLIAGSLERRCGM